MALLFLFRRRAFIKMVDQHSPPLPLSYLTLGDGDFSYSLDLCRFLATSTHPTTTIATAPSDVDQIAAAPAAVQITCTGIDTHHELQSKYRNVNSILNKIASLDEKRVAKRLNRKRKRSEKKKQKNRGGGGGDDDDDAKIAKSGLVPLSIRIDHGVNAIIMPNSTEASTTAASGANNNAQRSRYHHVIFNHPHLGTESAARHRRFLSHLFHSVHHHWLARDGGVFHLTLVLGQADRWDCLDAASRNGFKLLHRGEFKPPPPPPPHRCLPQRMGSSSSKRTVGWGGKLTTRAEDISQDGPLPRDLRVARHLHLVGYVTRDGMRLRICLGNSCQGRIGWWSMVAPSVCCNVLIVPSHLGMRERGRIMSSVPIRMVVLALQLKEWVMRQGI